MSVTGSIHVGDFGTEYRAECVDQDGEPFDPTTATTMKFIFKTKSGTIERDAEVDEDGGKFYLVYTVVEEDLEDGLHEKAGTYKWQTEVTFPGGQHYHTNIEAYSVLKNLN